MFTLAELKARLELIETLCLRFFGPKTGWNSMMQKYIISYMMIYYKSTNSKYIIYTYIYILYIYIYYDIYIYIYMYIIYTCHFVIVSHFVL